MSKLSFEEALASMKQGKKVKRASMSYVAISIIANRIHIWTRVEDDQWENVGVAEHMRDVNILADDWEVVE